MLILAVVTPYAYFELVNEVMGIKVGSGLNVIENADLDLHYVSSDLDNVNGKVVFEIGVSTNPFGPSNRAASRRPLFLYLRRNPVVV
jgi:hypothetical protein